MFCLEKSSGFFPSTRSLSTNMFQWNLHLILQCSNDYAEVLWGPSSQPQRKQLQIKITHFISRKMAAATLPFWNPSQDTGKQVQPWQGSCEAKCAKIPSTSWWQHRFGRVSMQAAAPRASHPVQAKLDTHKSQHSRSHLQQLHPLHLASPLQVEHLYSVPPQRSVSSSTGSSWTGGKGCSWSSSFSESR